MIDPLISLQSSRYNRISLNDEIQSALQYGVQSFDIFFDGFLPDDLSSTTLLLLRNCIKNGFSFSIHTPIDNYDTVPAYIPSITAFCREYSINYCTIHFDILSYDTYEHIISSLPDCTKLCIENTIPDLNNLYNVNYFTFVKKLQDIQPCYTTIDVGHAVINGYDPVLFCKNIPLPLTNIHVFHLHNNDGINDSHNDLTSGIIDFKPIINFAKSFNFKGRFIIEHWIDNKRSLDHLVDILN